MAWRKEGDDEETAPVISSYEEMLEELNLVQGDQEGEPIAPQPN